MTTNEKQNKQPEAGKKELTPRQIQMRKKMVVFPLFFLAFAGCMWLIFSPGEKEREEPSAGFNTELPTPESEGILSDKRDAYVQEEMRRREREKMRSLQDFAFGMEDEEEEPVMPAAVPDKSSGSAGGSSGAFRTSRAAYADINRQLGSFYEETAGENSVCPSFFIVHYERSETRLQILIKILHYEETVFYHGYVRMCIHGTSTNYFRYSCGVKYDQCYREV